MVQPIGNHISQVITQCKVADDLRTKDMIDFEENDEANLKDSQNVSRIYKIFCFFVILKFLNQLFFK